MIEEIVCRHNTKTTRTVSVNAKRVSIISNRHRAESRKIMINIRVESLFVYSGNCNFLHISWSDIGLWSDIWIINEKLRFPDGDSSNPYKKNEKKVLIKKEMVSSNIKNKINLIEGLFSVVRFFFRRSFFSLS